MKQLKLFIALFMCISALSFTACDKNDDENGGGNGNAYEAVDLGLSVKWATCNVGANSPEEYGDYFAWGEITPKKRYSSDNYELDFMNDDIPDDIAGNAMYDAATANWGGSWRMPTYDEMYELTRRCTWEWTEVFGIEGYKVTSKKNGNSIFLPAAGGRFNSDLEGDGVRGCYRVSNYYTERGSSLKISEGRVDFYPYMPEYGLTIRPVTD